MKPLSECVYAFVAALPTHAHGHPTEAERADLLAQLRKEPNMQRLTHRERAALDYLRAYITEHGYPPSRREIMMALDYRSPSAAAHLVSRGLALREEAV